MQGFAYLKLSKQPTDNSQVCQLAMCCACIVSITAGGRSALEQVRHAQHRSYVRSMQVVNFDNACMADNETHVVDTVARSHLAASQLVVKAVCI